jgi:hypothetical protein
MIHPMLYKSIEGTRPTMSSSSLFVLANHSDGPPMNQTASMFEWMFAKCNMILTEVLIMHFLIVLDP